MIKYLMYYLNRSEKSKLYKIRFFLSFIFSITILHCPSFFANNPNNTTATPVKSTGFNATSALIAAVALGNLSINNTTPKITTGPNLSRSRLEKSDTQRWVHHKPTSEKPFAPNARGQSFPSKTDQGHSSSRKNTTAQSEFLPTKKEKARAFNNHFDPPSTQSKDSASLHPTVIPVKAVKNGYSLLTRRQMKRRMAGNIPITYLSDQNFTSAIQSNCDGNFVLTEDVNLRGQGDVFPLCGGSSPFTGSLKSNGHKIRELNITKPNQPVGLFQAIDNSKIDVELDAPILSGNPIGAVALEVRSDNQVRASIKNGQGHCVSGDMNPTCQAALLAHNVTGDNNKLIQSATNATLTVEETKQLSSQPALTTGTFGVTHLTGHNNTITQQKVSGHLAVNTTVNGRSGMNGTASQNGNNGRDGADGAPYTEMAFRGTPCQLSGGGLRLGRPPNSGLRGNDGETGLPGHSGAQGEEHHGQNAGSAMAVGGIVFNRGDGNVLNQADTNIDIVASVAGRGGDGGNGGQGGNGGHGGRGGNGGSGQAGGSAEYCYGLNFGSANAMDGGYGGNGGDGGDGGDGGNSGQGGNAGTGGNAGNTWVSHGVGQTDTPIKLTQANVQSRIHTGNDSLPGSAGIIAGGSGHAGIGGNPGNCGPGGDGGDGGELRIVSSDPQFVCTPGAGGEGGVNCSQAGTPGNGVFCQRQKFTGFGGTGGTAGRTGNVGSRGANASAGGSGENGLPGNSTTAFGVANLAASNGKSTLNLLAGGDSHHPQIGEKNSGACPYQGTVDVAGYDVKAPEDCLTAINTTQAEDWRHGYQILCNHTDNSTCHYVNEQFQSLLSVGDQQLLLMSRQQYPYGNPVDNDQGLLRITRVNANTSEPVVDREWGDSGLTLYAHPDNSSVLPANLTPVAYMANTQALTALYQLPGEWRLASFPLNSDRDTFYRAHSATAPDGQPFLIYEEGDGEYGVLVKSNANTISRYLMANTSVTQISTYNLELSDYIDTPIIGQGADRDWLYIAHRLDDNQIVIERYDLITSNLDSWSVFLEDVPQNNDSYRLSVNNDQITLLPNGVEVIEGRDYGIRATIPPYGGQTEWSKVTLRHISLTQDTVTSAPDTPQLPSSTQRTGSSNIPYIGGSVGAAVLAAGSGLACTAGACALRHKNKKKNKRQYQPQRTPVDDIYAGTEGAYALEQGTQGVHALEQGTQGAYALKQGTQGEQETQGAYALEQGTQGVHALEQGTQGVHALEQGTQGVHALEQGTQGEQETDESHYANWEDIKYVLANQKGVGERPPKLPEPRRSTTYAFLQRSAPPVLMDPPVSTNSADVEDEIRYVESPESHNN